MIDATPGVPPHIAMLLNEEFDLADGRRSMRKLKGMLRELKDQSQSASSFALPIQINEFDGFKAVLSGGLDLFAGQGACQAVPCRVSYARQISRSIALMADQVVASDTFFDTINSLKSRPTIEEAFPLLCDLVVLKQVKPLIAAGLLKFSPPFSGLCSNCITSFDARIDQLTDRALREFGASLKVERDGDGHSIDFGAMYSPGIHVHLNDEFLRGKNDSEVIRSVLRESIKTIFLDAKSASWQGGSVFSNSNAGISALLSEDGRLLDSWDLRAFSAERSANLPWISGLTIEQTLNLRNEASSALPALREFMARRLSADPSSPFNPHWRDTVSELREQAAQVRSELEISISRSSTIRRNATGILGLCVSAVCLGTQGGEAALGGLLSTLGLIHSLPAKDSLPTKQIKAKPGYVLVAAEDILRHAAK